MWLALQTLDCKVKRTLAMVGSWIGVQLSLSTKYGLIPGPATIKRMIGNLAVLYSAMWSVYVVCTTDDV